MKKACVHTIAFPDWFPELCSLTLPRIEKWAKKIGADFHLIEKPQYPGFPPNYERFQIWEAGRGYFWNINIDADFILHRDLEDITENDPMIVRAEAYMVADVFFHTEHPYFERDGRNLALSDNFVLTSMYTHDLWQPIGLGFEELSSWCKKDPRQVSEFAVSFNMARFGLKSSGLLRDKSKAYHIQSTGCGKSREEILEIARAKIAEMDLNLT